MVRHSTLPLGSRLHGRRSGIVKDLRSTRENPKKLQTPMCARKRCFRIILAEMRETRSFYRGALPHYLPNDRPYFLTFRLAGSEPKDHEQLSMLLLKRRFLEYDRLLDTMVSGPHWLKEERIAAIVKEAIHHRDKVQYELHAYTIMSNHVHMVITLIGDLPLDRVLQQMKSYTAVACNKLLGRHGDFWLHEGYDHVVRKGRFGNVIRYVLNNPIKAGLCSNWRQYPHTYLSPDLKGFD
jgi:putative transposase